MNSVAQYADREVSQPCDYTEHLNALKLKFNKCTSFKNGKGVKDNNMRIITLKLLKISLCLGTSDSNGGCGVRATAGPSVIRSLGVVGAAYLYVLDLIPSCS